MAVRGTVIRDFFFSVICAVDRRRAGASLRQVGSAAAVITGPNGSHGSPSKRIICICLLGA
jgi:hypothetical protein